MDQITQDLMSKIFTGVKEKPTNDAMKEVLHFAFLISLFCCFKVGECCGMIRKAAVQKSER